MPPHTVIGIDLGSATVATALAETGQPAHALPLNQPISQPFYPAHLVIDAHGEIKRPDYTGAPTDYVTNLTHHLGQPPTVIAGAPWGVGALTELLMRPAIDAATKKLGHRPDMLAAVIPDHWPDYITDAFTTALATTGLEITTVPAPEAIAAAATLTHTTQSAITCIDFGERSATLTMALPDNGTYVPDIHRADPRGGRFHTDAALITHIVHQLDPGFTPTPEWEDTAQDVGRGLRDAARTAGHRDDLLKVNLPAPFSAINVPAGQVSDLVEDLVAITLQRLTSVTDIHHIWQVDKEEGSSRTLLVSGGFSQDKAVGTAIRTNIGAWRSHNTPQTLAAIGAAHLAAEGH